MYLKVVDFGFLLVLLLVRYDLNDLTSAEKLYAKTIDYFNEGYLQDGLLITMICLFVWSFIAKTFYFYGIYSNRKYYFAAVSNYWHSNIYAQLINGNLNTPILKKTKTNQVLVISFYFDFFVIFLSVLLFWIALSHNSFRCCWIQR